jgi:hypothetical protein
MGGRLVAIMCRVASWLTSSSPEQNQRVIPGNCTCPFFRMALRQADRPPELDVCPLKASRTGPTTSLPSQPSLVAFIAWSARPALAVVPATARTSPMTVPGAQPSCQPCRRDALSGLSLLERAYNARTHLIDGRIGPNDCSTACLWIAFSDAALRRQLARPAMRALG